MIDRLKYERPCGAAFAKYGGDLDVKAFGDRLALIDDWIVAARIKMATKGMRMRNNAIEECAKVVEDGKAWHKDYTADPITEIAAAIRHLKENPHAIKQEAAAIRALKDKP